MRLPIKMVESAPASVRIWRRTCGAVPLWTSRFHSSLSEGNRRTVIPSGGGAWCMTRPTEGDSRRSAYAACSPSAPVSPGRILRRAGPPVFWSEKSLSLLQRQWPGLPTAVSLPGNFGSRCAATITRSFPTAWWNFRCRWKEQSLSAPCRRIVQIRSGNTVRLITRRFLPSDDG